MQELVQNSSAIRAMFEEGIQMARQYGAENVYDFTLGNPAVPAPESVEESIRRLTRTVPPLRLHGYMPNAGFQDVRGKVAENLNKRYGTSYTEKNILMTVGAAGGLNVILKTLLDPGDEVLVFAPFFGEYRSYVENHQGVLKVVPPEKEHFFPNLEAAKDMMTSRTKAVILNNPNNPTGVVYPASVIRQLADLLNQAQGKFGTSICLISDEPYRELVYDGLTVPFLPAYYRNTVIGYSFSKSLSLPGERIGYLVIPDEMDDAAGVQSAAAVANRVLGFVNAPSLMQLAVSECLDEKADLAFYDRNRKMLCEGLSAYGYSFIRPQGAFYLWMKSPLEDERSFVQQAKEEHLLLVPGSTFAGPGFVRIAYCVSPETITRAMPAFRRLAEKAGLSKL